MNITKIKLWSKLKGIRIFEVETEDEKIWFVLVDERKISLHSYSTISREEAWMKLLDEKRLHPNSEFLKFLEKEILDKPKQE